MIDIHGTCCPDFTRVEDAFARNFDEGLDAGASVAVVHRGERVVDLWAGSAGDAPWSRDTLVNVFSATKGAAALAVAMLVDRELLDYEGRVVEYWPEFGAAGKEQITVAQVLSHQSGLPLIDEPLPDGAAADWDRMVAALERQAPLWEPGSATGYHTVTFSWLVGEIVRRAAGRTLGDLVRDEIAAPLGVDFFIGAPVSVDARIAPVILPSTADASGMPPPDSLFARSASIGGPPIAPALDTRAFRAMEMASTSGQTNARALATMYGTLAAGGEPLIGRDTLALATAERCAGNDFVLNFPVRRAAGWHLAFDGGRYEWGHNPRTFGHSGAGGSLGFADPHAGIGFGFAMTRILVGMGADPRWSRLVDAVYASVEDG